MDENLPHQTVVLLGAGHTNAHIVRMWKMQPIPATRLVCISNFGEAAYSGMLPGTLAGLYEPPEMRIDLVRFCRSAGALLIREPVTHLDIAGRQIGFDARPNLAFDLLSIGIGSEPDRSAVEPAAETVVAIKPMQTFLTRLDARLAAVERARGRKPLRVAIVGGGAAGLEIAFCLPGWLRTHWDDWSSQITVIDRHHSVGSGLTPAALGAVLREIERRGVELRLGTDVAHIDAAGLQFADGQSLPADLVLLTTSAQPPPLVATGGLPTDERGFLLVDATLQTTSGDPVFAVGDTGTIDGENLPKAGVYAVRQAPILWENIRRALQKQPLIRYRPQRSFLKLLNTGDGQSIASFWGLGWHSGWCWRWKDFLDRRFMEKYQDYELPQMDQASSTRQAAADAPAMRCVGCGGKVGGAVLSAVLERLEIPSHENVLVGLDAPDDAALVSLPEGRPLVTTVDFFAPPIDDYYLAGRIAALNAASDLFAMGARPIAALASITVPPGSHRAQEELLHELLSGGLRELIAMGATLAGGHTLEGPRVTIGFTMLGDTGGRPLRTKAALRPHQSLLLTKPLGSGALLAAHGQARCTADWMDALLAGMLQSNAAAAEICAEFDVPAMTDVTGFGLAGHLLEMLTASGVNAELDLAKIPLLPGFETVFQEGIESTLAPANRHVEPAIRASAAAQRTATYAALFDPQTCGGLLISAPADQADALAARITAAHSQPAVILGKTTERSDTPQIQVNAPT